MARRRCARKCDCSCLLPSCLPSPLRRDGSGSCDLSVVIHNSLACVVCWVPGVQWEEPADYDGPRELLPVPVAPTNTTSSAVVASSFTRGTGAVVDNQAQIRQGQPSQQAAQSASQSQSQVQSQSQARSQPQSHSQQAAASHESVVEDILPGRNGWVRVVDDDGYMFYHHARLGLTQWDMPADF